MTDLQISIIALNGKAVITSLQLAEHFGINHKHVLRDIRAILIKVPEIFAQSNFGLSEYTDATGRTLPLYHLTRDGFTLLAMGYNSRRAIEWKLKYIEAFNQLEQVALAHAQQAAFAKGIALHKKFPPHRMRQAQKALEYTQKGLSQREIAKLLDMNRRTVWHLLQDAALLALGV